MTRIQKITVFLLVVYAVWEIVVQIWAQNEDTAVIRVDLFIIYPILLILLLISLFQYIRKK